MTDLLILTKAATVCTFLTEGEKKRTGSSSFYLEEIKNRAISFALSQARKKRCLPREWNYLKCMS